ncbi:bacillithiol biosynthesis cysteine-adding enzyme BshC [Taibaiella chishuiensis]|uniref:Putative cysteine ligase BshC n=1 Tax=Taibaiella chishuiensis TaxID=1434707 RepID=A0A2P8D4A0_9BACT|nr:bacillithiol biosynthesis cysteine-adding enzyme BshC [Taibaiella chishuiensis]PSK92041.1 bacillithiol biosynthesis cysteine-adding enzyme BshC [Taibaiella chishuiensis]
METVCIPYQSTTFFSDLIADYLDQKDSLKPFYAFSPDENGLKAAIAQRKQMATDRATLVQVLKKQYEGYAVHPKVTANIESLLDENTFTVCTAHQPNLMTGYLYFIYKIIHAAKLARHLESLSTAERFVPVFYIGSEDNDLEELGVFRFNGIRFRWQTEQKGAVGRMSAKDLQPLLGQLMAQVGPPGPFADRLKEIILHAYSKENTIAAATRYLVNELLGAFGVVVLDPDDAALKRAFLPVLKEELLQPKSFDLVKAPSDALNEQYKAQAFARPINLFYLRDDIRERIEKTSTGWKVVRTEIHWNESELIAELEQHPERFSPNVILRGLYQETILPDVAFIGGGSEVAYWLQLKPVFDHYKIFYPAVILRQSVLWIDKASYALQQKIGLGNEELFEPAEQLVRSFVNKHTNKDLQLEDMRTQMIRVFDQIKAKATHIDVTLKSSAEAALTKMRHQLDTIEKKMMRAEKRNMAEQLNQIYKLKNKLFPNGSLQERYDTFMPYYLERGPAFFEDLMTATLPLGNEFLLLREV